MLDLKALLTKVLVMLKNHNVDYITAQGSSGNWRYRKWKSGKIEAWGTWSGSIACTTASQPYGGYRSASITSASIPSGIFTTTPKYVVATKNGSNAFKLMNFTATSATGTQFYMSCAASETNTVSLSIYAMQG